MEKLIKIMPKVELHLHIEGTLEPELMFTLAQQNKVALPYASIDEVKKAYDFHNLQSFLDIYYQACQVLQTTEDFYALAWHYLQKAQTQNIRHVEIFFDPQTHTDRGIPFDVVIEGLHAALKTAHQKWGITFKIIACFLRHLTENDAMITFQDILRHRDKIDGIGLDSSELGHPPEKFTRVFQKAKTEGFFLVAHAGEEGPPDYIWQAINHLEIHRIDHGVQCIEDVKLIQYLHEKKLPLTVCPLSNVKLKVYPELQYHPLKKFLEHQLCVTINSDDPAYFGGYLTENYHAIQQCFNLTKQELQQLGLNSISASFADKVRKEALQSEFLACF